MELKEGNLLVKAGEPEFSFIAKASFVGSAREERSLSDILAEQSLANMEHLYDLGPDPDCGKVISRYYFMPQWASDYIEEHVEVVYEIPQMFLPALLAKAKASAAELQAAEEELQLAQSGQLAVLRHRDNVQNLARRLARGDSYTEIQDGFQFTNNFLKPNQNREIERAKEKLQLSQAAARLAEFLISAAQREYVPRF